MPDLPTSKPALAGKAPLQGVQFAVEALPEGHLLQLMGPTTLDELRALFDTFGLGGSVIRAAGFRQWYVMGEAPLEPAALRGIAGALPRGVFLSDQSHGRIRIRVSGPRAAQVLARGTAVDLHGSAFPAGAAAMTLFGHIPVHLSRTGEAEFELTVLRSFAEALFGELEPFAA